MTWESSRRGEFTSTTAWRKFRLTILERDGNRCVRPACPTPTDRVAVDHIVNAKGGGAPFEPNNCETLCATHHASKTSAEGNAAPFWELEDLPALRQIVRLYDQVERGAFQRHAELRIAMDTYGITPKGQADRRWRPGEAPRVPEDGNADSVSWMDAYRQHTDPRRAMSLAADPIVANVSAGVATTDERFDG